MREIRGTQTRTRIFKYLSWLIFIGVLFIAPNVLGITNLVQRYRLPLVDALATSALVFGPAVIVAALIGAVVLASIEGSGQRRGSAGFGGLARGVVFVLFFAAWLRLLRGTLKANQIDLVPVETPFEIWGALLIGLPLFAFFSTRLSDWVDKTAGRLRFISALAVLVFVGLCSYLVIEPLNRGGAGPVTRSQPKGVGPNVIVIVLDTLTTRDMSLYGYHLPTTPNLDRFAANWTVYEDAHSTATSTIGMQPTTLTGRYPYLDRWCQYGDRARAGQGLLNLPQILRSFGYETIYGMGGGFHPGYYHLHTGFDQILGGGYLGYGHAGNPIHSFPGRDLLNQTVWNPNVAEAILTKGVGLPGPETTTLQEPMYATAAELLQERARAGSASPFFLYLHMSRPHDPFVANEFLGTFLPKEAGLANIGSQSGLVMRGYPREKQPQIDRLRLRYDENILKADQQVGDLLELLQELDLYDESLIVVTSDHGDNYVNGYQGHFSPYVYAAEHDIPLLVKYPGQTEGRRVDGLVSNLDIFPTVLEVVGATYPQEWVDGQSLSRAGQDPERIVYVSRFVLQTPVVDSTTVAVLSGDMKLVRRRGAPFLFNLASDPDEQVNLLGQAPADKLQRALDQFVRRGQFVRAGGTLTEAPALIDSADELRALDQPDSNVERR